jgi:hypothetical protein
VLCKKDLLEGHSSRASGQQQGAVDVEEDQPFAWFTHDSFLSQIENFIKLIRMFISSF